VLLGRRRRREVQAAIDACAARLGLTRGEPGPAYVPDQGDRDGAAPFWSLEGADLVYSARERGEVLFRRTTRSLDELLEWVFTDVTWGMAAQHEVAHRVPGQDSRRLLFATWVSLAGGLDPVWGEHVQAYVDDVLTRAPYDDSLG
jgi:hypothetical protein